MSFTPNWLCVSGKSRRVSIDCLACGQPFTVSRYEVEVRRRRFCSVACRSSMQRIEVPPKEHLESLYGGGMSVSQVAAHYNVSKGTVNSWLHQRQIETRMMSPSLANANRRRPRSRHGRRAVLGGLYVRSSWECNYALVLNRGIEGGLIERWEYEPDCFEFPVKRGSKFYTPDFKVFLPNGAFEYHEVKAWMDQPSRTKLRRMARYFPDVKIRVVGPEAYRKLEVAYGDVLEGWEYPERAKVS